MQPILFNNADEFLAELKKDRRKVYRGIVRVTCLTRTQGDFVQIALLASAIVEKTVLHLERLLGEYFRHDYNQAEAIRKKGQQTASDMAEKVRALKLEVRDGKYQ